MIARNDLHRLIRNLTPAEVRYFKRYAYKNSRNDENMSLQLFEAIANLDEYDETQLRTALGDLPMMRQLPVAKRYLHELILRVLGEYNAQKGIPAQLRMTLAQLEVLSAKGLMEDAKRRVEKGYQLALKFDQLTYALELLRWHIKLLKKTGSREDFQALPILQAQETTLLNEMATESELRKAHDEILAAFSLGIDIAQQAVADIIQSVLARPIMATLPSQLRFGSAIILHYIHIHASQFRRDLKTAQGHYQQMVALWEANPHRITEDMERYVITLISYLQISYQSLDRAAFADAITKLRKMSLPHSALAAKAFHYSYLLELGYAIDTGNPPLSPDLENQIIQGLDAYGGLIDPSARLSFYSNLAIFYFLHGDHNRSLKWTNLIYNSKDQTLRKDIRVFASCLRMVLQFELGDTDLLAYQLQATRRTLQRNKDQHPLQSTVVKHLSRLIQIPGQKQAQEWQTFSEALSALAKEHNEALSGIKTLLTWTESKAQSKSMLQIVQAQ